MHVILGEKNVTLDTLGHTRINYHKKDVCDIAFYLKLFFTLQEVINPSNEMQDIKKGLGNEIYEALCKAFLEMN